MSIARIKTSLAAAAVLLLLVIGYRLLHLFVPGLWLPADTQQFQAQAGVQRVDPHLYDSQWFDAARAGRSDITDALLQAGYPIDSQTSRGHTALILATYHGDLDEVNALLRAHADPCLADNNGNTALMGALFKGEMAIARRLIGLCPIDTSNNDGQTALSFAALFGRLDILAELVRHGADLQHRDARGNTALMISESQGNDAAVAALKAIAGH